MRQARFHTLKTRLNRIFLPKKTTEVVGIWSYARFTRWIVHWVHRAFYLFRSTESFSWRPSAQSLQYYCSSRYAPRLLWKPPCCWSSLPIDRGSADLGSRIWWSWINSGRAAAFLMYCLRDYATIYLFLPIFFSSGERAPKPVLLKHSWCAIRIHVAVSKELRPWHLFSYLTHL